MKQERKEKLHQRFQLVSVFLKLFLLLVILVGIPAYLWIYHQDFLTQFSDVDQVKEFFSQYETAAILVLVALQVLQILISIIPGQGIQLAAGLLYGVWFGLIISWIGALIGTIVTYYAASLLGRDALHVLFGKRGIDEMLNKINSKRGMVLVFLVYLIPGVPKDLATYAAGISKMNFHAFLIISMVGRTPGMLGSIIIGQELGEGDYTSVIIIAAVAVVLSILGVVFHHRLSRWLDIIYSKLFSQSTNKQ